MEVIVNLVMSKSSGFRGGGGIAEKETKHLPVLSEAELVATAVVPRRKLRRYHRELFNSHNFVDAGGFVLRNKCFRFNMFFLTCFIVYIKIALGSFALTTILIDLYYPFSLTLNSKENKNHLPLLSYCCVVISFSCFVVQFFINIFQSFFKKF
jgi:hypothetical protein